MLIVSSRLQRGDVHVADNSGAGISIQPILLTGPIAKVDANKVFEALRNFAANAKSDLSRYPPTSGSSYRRTGRLGRSWTQHGPRKSGDDIEVIVGTNVEYAGYVEGFKPTSPVPAEAKQTRLMAARGWPSLEDVLDRRWGEARKAILDAIT